MHPQLLLCELHGRFPHTRYYTSGTKLSIFALRVTIVASLRARLIAARRAALSIYFHNGEYLTNELPHCYTAPVSGFVWGINMSLPNLSMCATSRTSAAWFKIRDAGHAMWRGEAVGGKGCAAILRAAMGQRGIAGWRSGGPASSN
jgi:hypothetical protein